MQIRRKIKFILHRRNPEQTTGLGIRMRVTVHSRPPIDVPLGESVDLSDWDATTGYTTSSSVNAVIDQWRAAMNDVFAKYELIEKRIPTPDEIKADFNVAIGRVRQEKTVEKPDDKQPGFFKVFDKFMLEMGTQNNWTDATHTKFKTIKKYIKTVHPRMTFEQLDDAAMVKIMQYMTRIGLRNTTIAKHMAFIRWFIRWSSSHGYYDGKTHETFHPKIKGSESAAKEIIYCTLDELKRIETHEFVAKDIALEHVRDVFVFCCYTGLRYSDVAKLRRSDVKKDCIRVVTQKTTDMLTIELNTHARAIIDKYEPFHFPDGRALPVISNQKMNEQLKVLGKVCELNDPVRLVYYVGNVRHENEMPKWSVLTTHCARRTFVVMALQLGIPADVIMKWTGHSCYNAMKPYIAIVDDLKRRSMQKFDTI